MPIKLYIKNSHSKFFYDECSEEEKNSFKQFIIEKFTVKDTSLERDFEVMRGWKSALKCFYKEGFDIIQTGLVPYVKAYVKKNNFDVEFHDLRKFQKPNLKILEQLKTKGFGKFKLRDYQIEAIDACLKYRNGIISSPPATGKSLIIGALCKIYDKSKFLLIFNMVDLLSQTYQNFIDDYGFSKDDIDIVGMGESNSTGARITLLSLQSYKNLFHEFPYIDIIIADETHSVGRTETSEKVIFSCQNAAHKFGFSATPDVIENPYEQMRLYANVGPIIFKKTFQEQIDNKVLADTTAIIHKIIPEKPIKIVGSWNDIYDRRKVKDDEARESLLKQGFEIVKEGQEEIARKFVAYGDESLIYILNYTRNQKIKEIAQSSERVLILFSKIKHGQLLKELIPEAILVSGKDDLQSRKIAKEELAKNPKAIILASSIFDVGVDVPAIKNLIVAGLHVSIGRTIQKAGRATRKNESIGKLSATIHDFDNSENALAIKQTKKKIKIYEEIMKLKMIFK